MKNELRYCPETQNALERFLCGRSLLDGCKALDYPARKEAMLRDVLHGRWDHVSAATLDDLRQRLGLPPVPVIIPAIPCPTCGVLHQLSDCHGAKVQMVRRKAPRRIQDMTINELTLAVWNRKEIVL